SSALFRDPNQAMAPTLQIHLDPIIPPQGANGTAILQIALLDNKGQHGVVTQPGGTLSLTSDDGGFNCGICVTVLVTFTTATSTVTQELWAHEGTLQVTASDMTGMTATLGELKLQQVNEDLSDTGPPVVPGGCSATIHEITFSKMYGPPV